MTGFEHLLAGRTLGGRYRIEALIGRGGMGAVYQATDERLGRPVAVKVISPPAGVPESTRQELRARFQREARAAARLHHPNVVTIHDFGTDEELGLDYLVMGLLHGDDLAARIARGDPLTLPQVVELLRGAARGLAAGHRIGLVHRDVKPGNLFLCGGEVHSAEEVRVLDFGIAKAMAGDEGTLTHLTRFGHAPLSPAYAAPEQLRAEGDPTPACDVYGLGAIGWELLAGRRPFTDDDIRRVGDGRHVPPPTPPAGSPLDGPLGSLLLRCIAIDPTHRPADAEAFLAALDDAMAGREPPPLPAKAPIVARPFFAAREKSGETLPSADRPSLVECPDCGQMVSRHAPTCPRCGAPLGRKRRRGAGTVAAFVVGGLLVGGSVFAAARQGVLPNPGAAQASTADSIAGLLDTVRVEEVRKPVHVPAPEWQVLGVETDGGCGGIFDACLRVRCTVANAGDAAGETEVTARLVGERTYSRTRAVRMEAGGQEVLYFDFPEVHNGERFERATCRPAQSAEADPQPAENPDTPPPDAAM
jgi:serine/threonine protein kinase